MGEVKFPPEWITCSFAYLVSNSFTGLVRSAQEQGGALDFKYLKMNNLDNRGNFLLDSLTRVNATKNEIERYSLEKGDFIFNTRNSVELVGKCGVFDVEPTENILFNNNLLKITFFEIDPKLIAHWLNSPSGKRDLSSITSATTSVAAIYQKQLFGLELPLPPLAEQKVIAEKLDALLAQVETTKARLEHIPDIIKRFRQSVLAAAVSGRLTEEWREQKHAYESVAEYIESLKLENKHKPKPYEPSATPYAIPSQWSWQRLGDIYTLKSGKSISAEQELNNGDYSYFKVGDMNHSLNQFDMNFSERYASADVVSAKSLLEKDSIIFPKRGGAISTNKKRILRQPALVDLNIMGICPNRVSTLYTYFWFLTIDLSKLNTGSTIPQINNGDIEPLWVPIPSRVEQTEIVRRVEQLFAFADTIEQKANAALERVNNLTQSMLAKAFRGELTADWRAANLDLISGENSAAALLERIKAEREIPQKRRKGS